MTVGSICGESVTLLLPYRRDGKTYPIVCHVPVGATLETVAKTLSFAIRCFEDSYKKSVRQATGLLAVQQTKPP